MKIPKRILKITGALILSVIVLLFIVSAMMQDKVAGIVFKSLNRNFATKIETGSYHLSLIKKFPKASFELKNVIVYSSHGFDKAAFKGINTDTLLTAKSASVDFKIIDLIRGAYTFKTISVRTGNLNLFTDTADHYNYDVSIKDGGDKSDKKVRLNLNRIHLSDIRVVYNDLRVDLVLKSTFNNGRFKSKIRGGDIDFEGTSEVVFDLFQLNNTSFRQIVKTNIDIGLNKNDKGIFFRKSTMSFEKQDIVLTGFIASDNYLDLDISGKSIDISKLTPYIPDKYRKITSEYNPSGILKFDCKIKGKPTRYQDPNYDISFSLKNAGIDHTGSDFKINRLSFNGSITNGIKNSPKTSSFKISNFKAGFGSADYKGSFSASDFSKPAAELTFSGTIYPSEIKEFLGFGNIGYAGGSIDLNIRLSGLLEKKDHYSFADLSELDSRSEFEFKSFGITLTDKNLDLKNACGKIFLTENTVTDNFTLLLNDQKFTLSGNLIHFSEWLAGKPVCLTGSASVVSPCLKPELFMKDTPEKAGPDATSAPLTLPNDVAIDLNFSFDTLTYKKFNAEKIRGQLSFKPKTLNFRSIKLNSQDGVVSGNGLVVQNHDKSLIGRGSFTVNDVDVKKSFTSFNNFGQNFLKAENIEGALSGTITLLLPVDSMLNPVMKSLTAEGKYVLTDGALIDFDPVKALSSFIELSELENIKFDRLDNEFFIRNNNFYVPQMEIRSSAVDLSVNGTHSFDNDYEYHVRMHLSEILSNKDRKNRKTSSEFGEVEDDGLGRTYIFLRIDGKGEDVDVSYDVKAAGNKIKNDIKNERQNLKTILNEEYGLYPSSNEPAKEQASKPKFRISWEGTETTNTKAESSSGKKESIIRKIFRKK